MAHVIPPDDESYSGVVVPGLYRSRSLPHYLGCDSGVGSFSEGGGGGGGGGADDKGGGGGGGCPSDKGDGLVGELRQLITLRQHYYPEGGWGWVVLVASVAVHLLSHGLQLSAVLLPPFVHSKFGPSHPALTGWLGPLSTSVALLVSPVTIAFCRRKSTRLTAVIGGLVTALAILFTSFASQFHQLFISYGIMLGIGVSMTRDCSTLMVAQYFKRRRELVEIFIVSGSGLGIAVMSIFIKHAISAIGWRLGLQLVTLVVVMTFFLGTCYRSASLYHPQRRAILHLKNQKRKIKDKNKVDDGPPFFDVTTLRSKTVRILLFSTGVSAFGLHTPIFFLAGHAETDGLGNSILLIQTYMGLAWVLGSWVFGALVLHNTAECRIARQYLTQVSALLSGVAVFFLTTLEGNHQGYVLFAWVYGLFLGGYNYSLKMYVYERVRARNFARTWGYVQCSQAIPMALGVPITGYINVTFNNKSGYYFSASCIFLGSLMLFLIDCHKRRLSRHKHNESGEKKLCESEACPQRRKPSFSLEPEELIVVEPPAAAQDKPELTCISEEGIADMDLPDNILDDLDYIGDCITSCNKVENYLMLSEFENNLIAEMPVIMDRKGRRWSLARQAEEENPKGKWRLIPGPNRVITVIDEASV